MRQITFKDTGETFDVMAQDERYIVCSRIYTVEDSKRDIAKYYKKEQEFLVEMFPEDKYETIEDWENDKESSYLEFIQDFIYENGDQPTEYEEDVQCYTIVDLKEKIRGADNYGNKFNYLDKDECREALKELNKSTNEIAAKDELEISRRNKIELSEYQVVTVVYIVMVTDYPEIIGVYYDKKLAEKKVAEDLYYFMVEKEVIE